MRDSISWSMRPVFHSTTLLFRHTTQASKNTIDNSATENQKYSGLLFICFLSNGVPQPFVGVGLGFCGFLDRVRIGRCLVF